MIPDRLRETIGTFDLQTDLWWLAMMMTGLLGSVLGAFAFPGSGLFWLWLTVLVRLSIAVSLAQLEWGRFFGRLLEVGLVAGIFAIFADYLLVRAFRSGQLVYPGPGVFLESPAHVPLAWGCYFVEFGYLVARMFGILSRRWPGQTGMGLTLVISGLVTALVVGSQEYLAVRAGWWDYKPAHAMLGDEIAVHVMAARGLFFGAFLPVLSRYFACDGGRVFSTIRYGIIFGGVLFSSHYVCYLLVEGPFN